ncbi:MAG TPA: hypothetical protein VGE09_03130 [Pseudoxanthomonas sp.]
MKGAADKLKALIPSEAELCSIFMHEFSAEPGWTCYPETAGFDIVVAHEDGRQIGVEAKLQLNAKVADQILPADSWYRYGAEGPDHRLVIVRGITEANAGIARMLKQMGVMVWAPGLNHRAKPETQFEYEEYAYFNVHQKLWTAAEAADPPRHEEHGHHWLAWFDWNPARRLALPHLPPSLPAGVPAPVRLTPWKQAALRVLARLRVQGHITAKEIVAEGCSPSMWTQRWLKSGPIRGQWLETELLPAFDKQHPDIYAVALENARTAAAGQPQPPAEGVTP